VRADMRDSYVMVFQGETDMGGSLRERPICEGLLEGYEGLSYLVAHVHSHLPSRHEKQICDMTDRYGVATISRLLQSVGLFCKRAL